MGNNPLCNPCFPHKFSDQFDTSQSEKPRCEERKVTQKISDEIDSYSCLSSKTGLGFIF
jgi:hypothetical protein